MTVRDPRRKWKMHEHFKAIREQSLMVLRRLELLEERVVLIQKSVPQSISLEGNLVNIQHVLRHLLVMLEGRHPATSQKLTAKERSMRDRALRRIRGR